MKIATSVLRWTLYLLPIFGFGFWAGRLSSAHWRMEVVHFSAAMAEHGPGLDGEGLGEDGLRLARRLEKSFASALELSPEQLTKIQPVLLQAGEKMASTQKEESKRREVLREIFDQLSPYLTEEQKPLSFAIVENHSQR